MKEEPAMTSIARQVEAFQRILEKQARLLAKATGFIEREPGAQRSRFRAGVACGLVRAPG